VASRLSLTHLKSIFNTDWLCLAGLLLSSRNLILNLTKIKFKFSFWWMIWFSWYTVFMILLDYLFSTKMMISSFDCNFLFHCESYISESNVTLWIIELDLAVAFFIWEEGIFFKCCLDWWNSIINTAPGCYFMGWSFWDALLEIWGCLSNDEDLLVVHFILITSSF